MYPADQYTVKISFEHLFYTYKHTLDGYLITYVNGKVEEQLMCKHCWIR